MPATTTHSDSDSEDDLDYVPPADEHNSDSEDERDKGGNSLVTVDKPEIDPTEDKKHRDTLWANFQASVSTPSVSRNGSEESANPANRVQIEKTFLFAGKYITEIVEVPKDSEEAKKWPRWTPTPRDPGLTGSSGAGSTSAPAPRKASTPSAEGESKDENRADPSRSPSVIPASSVAPAAKRPGPRKPRTALPSLPSKAPNAKKITTLDKSAMDWRAHVSLQSGDVQSELDANRRGGGYLEKVDFLQRVQDRREDALEASKSNKRRRM